MATQSSDSDVQRLGISGLVQTGLNTWKHTAQSSVSYPVEGLAALARIEEQSYWFTHRNAVITQIVKRYAPSGAIFDIGGGNGCVSLALRREGFNAIVMEPDQSGIEVAKARGLPTIQAAFQSIDVIDDMMPAAGLFDVLEHIEDDAGALSRLFKMLKRNGIIFVSVPAYNFLWSVEDAYSGHFRRYTLGKLSELLTSAGFKPIFSTYFFSVLVPAVFLGRTLPTVILPRKKASPQVMLSQHMLPDSFIGRFIALGLRRELDRLDREKTIPAGTSCFMVAQKV